MVLFKALDDFRNWIFGDPTLPTFETRKTIFEAILAATTFIVLKNVLENVLDIEL